MRSLVVRLIAARAGALRMALASCLVAVASGCAEIPRLPADAPMAQRVSVFKEQADRALAKGVAPDGPGLAVVVRADGKVVYRAAAGMADIAAGQAIDERTPFELASLSKPVTAMAVLRLVDQGTIALADPVGKWIPELPPTWPAITIHQLLSQQSGIPDFMIRISSEELGSLDGLTNDGVIERLRNHPDLLFPPGTQSRYNNTNYVLLAEVVARATHMSFPQYLSTGIFAPLGLSSSFAQGGEPGAAPARALDFGRTESTNGIRLRTVGPTGIWSSADDVSQLLQDLLAGRVLAPATVQAMTSPQSGQAVFEDGERYGYGWALPAAGKLVSVFAHAGQKDGFRTIAFVDVAHKLDYVILSNGGDATGAVMDRIRILFQTLLEQPNP